MEPLAGSAAMGDGLLECPNCGIRNRAGARHCRSCGITLDVAGAPARQPNLAVDREAEPAADEGGYAASYGDDYVPQPEGFGGESYFALRLGSVMAKMGAVVLLVVGWGLLVLSRLPLRTATAVPASLVALSLPMVLLYAVAIGVASCLVWAIGDALRVVLKIARRVR